MRKEDYIKIAKKHFKNNSRKIILKQIDKFYDIKDKYKCQSNLNIGDDVYLKKGTLLHGTFKNIDGLKEIVENGLIAGEFVNTNRGSKYPSSIGLWNLTQDYYLKDYINFYSGGTARYKDFEGNTIKTEVIPLSEIGNISKRIDNTCYRWLLEQTKEARYLPSLVQDKIQIGIIFDSQNEYIKELLGYDILTNKIDDKTVKQFINKYYYHNFIKERTNKDDFFTNRESAILFGIPSCFIIGVLVGKEYEQNEEILNEIKSLLPNSYICNLDGKVIR